MSGNYDKVKANPKSSFLDTLEPACSFEVKTEIFKKNLTLLTKMIKKGANRFLKLFLNSFAGAHIDLNFTLDYLKRQNNSFLQMQNQNVAGFIKIKLNEILEEISLGCGGFNLFKKFYDSINNNFTVVLNTSQIHATAKIDISGIENLLK